MTHSKKRQRRGIIADAFRPVWVVLVVLLALLGIYLVVPFVYMLRSLALSAAAVFNVPSKYIDAVGGIALFIMLAWYVVVLVFPIFRRPRYTLSAQELSPRKLDRFIAGIIRAGDPDTIEEDEQKEHGEAMRKLSAASTHGQKLSALEDLGHVRRDIMRKIVTKHVLFVATSTAISKRSWLDGYFVITANMRMIRELVTTSGIRPSYWDMVRIYGDAFIHAFTSIGVEEVMHYAAVEKGITVSAATAGEALKSALCILAQNFGLPTTGISHYVDKVLGTGFTYTPEMIGGMYNGWRTMCIGYYLSAKLSRVFGLDADDNAHLKDIIADTNSLIGKTVRRTFMSVFKKPQVQQATPADDTKCPWQEEAANEQPMGGDTDRPVSENDTKCPF